MKRRPWILVLGVGCALALLLGGCGDAAVQTGDGAGRPQPADTASVAPLGTAPTPPALSGSTTAPPVAVTTPTAPTTSALATTTTAPAAVPTTAKAPGGQRHTTATVSLPLVDASRPTVSRGTTIAPSRSLPTTVYYPTDGGGPFPLLVFAHGFEIGPGPYAHFAGTLAAAGYVVAAPSFPLTDRNAAGANLDRGDLANQAADVTYVFDAVVGAAGAGPLRGLVDGARLGVVGHSDGADTALDVGYYPGRADPRVRGVVAVAPDAMTGAGGSVGAGVPLLLAHGDRDSIVPISNSQTVFEQVRSHRFFAVLSGANHLPPVQGAAPHGPVVEQLTVDFLDHYVAGRVATDDPLLEHGSRPGVVKIQTRG